MRVGITDKPYVRDTVSNAILSTDKAGLQKYLLERDLAKKKKEEEIQLKHKVDQMESDIKDIKKLLQELVNK